MGRLSKAEKERKYGLYHPDHGTVSITRDELFSLEPRFKGNGYFRELINGRELRIYNWILAKNIDNVPSPRNRNIPRKYYCAEHGIVECTIKEFCEKYIKPEGGTYDNAKSLTCGAAKTVYNKWVLAENKDNYKELVDLDKSSIITLYHPFVGTLTLKRSEFISKYGLTKTGITKLKSKALKTHRGWKLID